MAMWRVSATSTYGGFDSIRPYLRSFHFFQEEPSMTDDHPTGASPQATEKLIEAWTAHVNATDALDGLGPDQAVAELDGWPHSIAGQIAHMLFWQRHTQAAIETGTEREVASAAEGWPSVTGSGWSRLRDDFLAALEQNKAYARDPEVLARRFGDRKPYTVGVRLLIMSTHDSYHLGQIVMQRRVMGAWPPPAGGDTW
jgi:uncharacterized damage-inducible protein DinB